MSVAEVPAFEHQMQQIESHAQTIERSADENVRTAASELVRAVLDLHAAGFAKVLELLSQSEAGRAIRDACVRDELVGSLLLLHGLHPDDLEARVRQALDGVRPYLNSHGGDVELLEIADGMVRLQMQGSCNGCPSSSATLRQTIERAIYEAAPDVAAIEVAAASAALPASGFVELQLQAR